MELEEATASVPNVPIILVKVCHQSFLHPTSPVLKQCLSQCIARIEANITEQGVYRVSGNASDVQACVVAANKGVPSSLCYCQHE